MLRGEGEHFLILAVRKKENVIVVKCKTYQTIPFHTHTRTIKYEDDVV